MAVGNDQIQPAIVVKIDKASAPTKKRKRDLAESGQKSYIGKISIAVVVIEHVRVVRKVCNVETDTARVVIIADRDSHSRLLSSVLVQSNPRRVADLFESSIAFVYVDQFRS